MFSGLVESTGVLKETRRGPDGLDLTIECDFQDLHPGESIAVNGACLTVAALGEGTFQVHVIRSSLDRTSFGEYAAGQTVNLERAVKLGDRLGGHLVQGHVDGVGTVVTVAEREDARLVNIEVPPEVFDLSIPLGSITVDGVSLTINAIMASGRLQVSLIPHTLAHTTLGSLKPGDRVHLEADMIGKYVQRLLNQHGR
jgi:riboflavin synthase